MIATCPRCGSPREGERPFCHTCGFDFKSVAASPVTQPQEPAPSPAPPPAFSQPPSYSGTSLGQAPSDPQASYGQQPFQQPPQPPQPQQPPQPPQPQSPYGQPAGFGQQAPQFGQQAPQFGQQAPQFGQQPPQAQQPPQSPYGQPAAFGQAPQFGQQAYGQPAQPTTCPRCNAPLYPGYPTCTNCGLDLRGYGVQMSPVPAAAVTGTKKSSRTPLLVAVAGLVLVLAAGGFVMASRNSASSSPSPKPSPSAIAVASPTPTDTPEIIGTDTPAPDATDTPETVPTDTPEPIATDQTTAEPATPEPAPSGPWTKYASKDGKWSVKFPVATAPTQQTTNSGSGAAAMSMTYYFVMDPTSASLYAVYVIDTKTDMSVMGSSAFLDYMKTYMNTYLTSQAGATLISSDQITMAGKPALRMVVDAAGERMTLCMTGIGSRMYMLMAAAPATSLVYPSYFFGTFAAK